MKSDLVLARSIRFRSLGLSALMVLLAWFAYGQSTDEVHILSRGGAKALKSTAAAMSSDGTPSSRNPSLLRVDVDLVLVPVTISDSKNHTVTTLKKEDFAVYEDNKRQEIRYFSTEDVPISVALLVDVSKSMSDKIDAEREAIVKFFNNANPDDEYFAIAFSDHPRVVADSTQSIDQLEGKLLAEEPGGPTAMLDAVYLAVSKLRSARYERKAILILSDGGDNNSRYRLREIKSVVQESDIQIYAVGLFETFFFNTIEERLGKEWLSEITDATGGRTITVDNRGKVPEAAASISREMRNQYVLGYRPMKTTKTKRRKIKIRLTSTDERFLRAYYKQGYLTY
ncbi:MAG: VWA domain-containing protein [Candidatus Sulfotelmatobacter sp.]